MRIAHVTDFYLPRLGGIETHIAGLAAHQRALGHDVEVISSGGLVESSAGLLRPDRRAATFDSFHPAAIRPAVAAVLDRGYDAVHVHMGLATPLAFTVARAASRAGRPTVATMHSVIGPLAPIYRAAEPVIPWRAWPIVWTAVSELAAAPIRDMLGGARSVAVLPNAVDAGEWAVDPASRDDRDVMITAVMRLAPRKRPIELLRALRAARAATPDGVSISATIIGEGSERASMERYLSRHHMSNWVALPGRLTHAEIRDAFRRTDVFVAPAIHESFGIAALEARAAGLPVVAMQDAGISEFIRHGRDGLLVADDAGLASALTLLAGHPEIRSAMAAHNRRVPSPFGWTETLASTGIAYERASALQHARTHERVSRPIQVAGRLPAVTAPAYRDLPA
jgi:glycosyltransferase involved in cell wall biosynthesis